MESKNFIWSRAWNYKLINNFKNDQIKYWDIGANIGLYSIYSALAHKDIKVISFEPSTSNLRVLSRNISINNLSDKISINQFAWVNLVNVHETMNETKFEEGYSMSTFYYQTDFQGIRLNLNKNIKFLVHLSITCKQ